MINDRRYHQSFYDSVSARAEKTAQITRELISSFLTPESLIDIGSGDGVWTFTYLSGFSNLNATVVDLPETQFKFINNLSSRVHVIQQDFELGVNLPSSIFDLAICVEVIEHLSPRAAQELISYICKHSKVVLFSGATKGQGGTHHINENTQSFWIESMVNRGMKAYDVVRPVLSGEKEVPSYYKNNIFLYVNESLLGASELLYINEKLDSLPHYNFDDQRTIAQRILHKILSLFKPKLITRLASLKSNFEKATFLFRI